jgi:hypothetical protein
MNNKIDEKKINQDEFIKKSSEIIKKIKKELNDFDMTIFDNIDDINFDFETENEKNFNLD